MPATTASGTSGATPSGMWRFAAHLPAVEPDAIVTLGEGDTPLLRAMGPTLTSIGSVAIKAEYQNPTGSFKDRIAAMATAIIRSRGLTGAVGTSSGNGGAAMAAFGARAGFPVVLFTTSGIVDGKLRQIQAHGTFTHLVDGLGAGGRSAEGVAPTIAALAEDHGWYPFLTGARYAPEAMAGAETIAFELAEQHPGASAVYVPVGGGGLLGSIWRGYQRLDLPCPALVGVQPAGCPTLARAVVGDRSPTPSVTTTISGLQVSVLFDWGAIDAVATSGGHVVEVDDQSVWDAQRVLAREEGIFVEPAGATALAGVLADRAAGRLAPDAEVVVVATGAGHKDQAAVERLGADHPPVRISPEEIPGAFGRQRGDR